MMPLKMPEILGIQLPLPRLEHPICSSFHPLAVSCTWSFLVPLTVQFSPHLGLLVLLLPSSLNCQRPRVCLVSSLFLPLVLALSGYFPDLPVVSSLMPHLGRILVLVLTAETSSPPLSQRLSPVLHLWVSCCYSSFSPLCYIMFEKLNCSTKKIEI